jgi:hypothetical protein
MDSADGRGMRKRLTVIMIAVISLTAAVMILVSDGSVRKKEEDAAGRTFQRTVCGLGIGSALRPDWGFETYDPRVDAADDTRLWPVPGGYSYSPEKGMMGESP